MKVRTTLSKKLNNYLADRQILNGGNRWFHYNTTQVEMDRVTINGNEQTPGGGGGGHQGNEHQPPVLTVSPASEKHPRHFLRTAHSATQSAPSHEIVSVSPITITSSVATTQV